MDEVEGLAAEGRGETKYEMHVGGNLAVESGGKGEIASWGREDMMEGDPRRPEDEVQQGEEQEREEMSRPKLEQISGRTLRGATYSGARLSSLAPRARKAGATPHLLA